MSTRDRFFKRTVATGFGLVMISVLSIPAMAQESEADLLARLKIAPAGEAQRIANQIFTLWSKSGSPAMDLLLKRGRDAMEVGDFAAAADHFGALTDHAPDFAEGWQQLALVYFRQERFGPAMDALEHALALNPNHFGAMRGVAAIYEVLERPDLAYRAYQLVLSINPHDSEVIEAIARLEPRARGVSL